MHAKPDPSAACLPPPVMLLLLLPQPCASAQIPRALVFVRMAAAPQAPPVGDGDLLGAFCYLVVPVALELRPDVIIVSAGFDAADGDPMGGCESGVGRGGTPGPWPAERGDGCS